MQKLMDQVREFVKATGQKIGSEPGDAFRRDVKLGLQLIHLIREELTEFEGALLVEDPEGIPDIAYGLGDLLYVITWTALVFGFPMVAIMDEIHRSNMTKFGRGVLRDENGKVVKPPGWEKPHIKAILQDAKEEP